ncbi:MAG: cystathionine beta-lyase, partial [Gammaproteobacteria bacterium]|nr:cystathionine beta-lyase [Gammaproteobacteria bacterium]
FESLCIPVHPGDYRISPQWTDTGPMLRIHAGLEDILDLQADLDAGFERLRRVANGAD